MSKRTIGILAFLILFLATSSFAQQKEKGLSLSLEDCILKAMENNLGVAIEVLNPELADISVSRAQERFKNLRKNIHDRLSSIRSQLKNEIKNVLTDEQVLEFEAMIEKYISQRKKEVEKRKKHPRNHRKDKGEKR